MSSPVHSNPTANARPKHYFENEEKLCQNKDQNEYFRLNTTQQCHEVFQCTEFGLLPLRCSPGLAFDVEKQTCDWKTNVKNCDQLESK